MLLNAGKCKGFSFYRFWVSHLTNNEEGEDYRTEGGGGGGGSKGGGGGGWIKVEGIVSGS